MSRALEHYARDWKMLDCPDKLSYLILAATMALEVETSRTRAETT